MWNTCLLIFGSLLQLSVQKSTPQDASYVAAVVEYQVQSNVEGNILNYVQLIQDAAQQNADIVVFPEMTLSRGDIAAPVPIHGLLKQYPIPALQPTLFHEILVNISAAARQHEVYVVINIQESLDCTLNTTEELCPEEKAYLFNTNVVFDRIGAVIDRYRKINLFGEFTRTPAFNPDLGVFPTDFGVTFGHFICFDLMFQVPAIQVVEKYQITDVIFPTMWFSEMPYLTAVQIQEAYAYALNVNFLGAGANNVRVGSAGSGIYSGKAGALVSIMPGLPATRLLVSRVPKVPGQVNFPVPGPIYDNPTDHDSLRLITDPSLPSHISRLLTPGFQEFTLTDKEVSCKFTVRLNQRAATRYNYRAVAFSGIRSFTGMATGGSRTCAVLACIGDDMWTCGMRFDNFIANSTVIFEELVIEAHVPTPAVVPSISARDSAFFPLSLGVSILPLETADYTYTENNSGATTVYTLTLNNRDVELYTFAVWGRLFERDGLEETPPLNATASTEANPTDTSAAPTTPAVVPPTTPATDASVVVSLQTSLLAIIFALFFMIR